MLRLSSSPTQQRLKALPRRVGCTWTTVIIVIKSRVLNSELFQIAAMLIQPRTHETEQLTPARRRVLQKAERGFVLANLYHLDPPLARQH